MEEWRTIKDFPDYQVSNMGRVKSLKHNKEYILKTNTRSISCQYLCVVLYDDLGNKITNNVHSLVASAFLVTEPNKPFIDHINRNKKDNRLENLKYCTNSENQINTDDRPVFTSNTGEPYIYFEPSRNKYIFRRNRFNQKYSKRFKTLEEAIAYRDSILHQNSSHLT